MASAPPLEPEKEEEERRQVRKLMVAVRALLRLDYIRGVATASEAGVTLARSDRPTLRQAGTAVLGMLPNDVREKAMEIVAIEALAFKQSL